jgi:hypothetical protein
MSDVFFAKLRLKGIGPECEEYDPAEDGRKE